MYDRVVAGTIFKVFGMTQESIKDRTFFLFAIYRLSKKVGVTINQILI